MKSILIPLCGSFAIHSFGLAILCGLGVFAWCIYRDKRTKNYISSAALSDMILVGVVAALFGGRVLAILGDPEARSESVWEWLQLWDGGISSLGCIIGVLVALPCYFYYRAIPMVPVLDLIAVYAPIIHIFVRIGCFLAGCCFGAPTQAAWGIIYHDQDGLAPCGIPLHPTQLYSMIALCIIFALMLWIRKANPRPGVLTGGYLFLINAERFAVDFFRGDREFIMHPYVQMLSLHQWLSLGLMFCGILVLVTVYTKRVMFKRL